MKTNKKTEIKSAYDILINYYFTNKSSDINSYTTLSNKSFDIVLPEKDIIEVMEIYADQFSSELESKKESRKDYDDTIIMIFINAYKNELQKIYPHVKFEIAEINDKYIYKIHHNTSDIEFTTTASSKYSTEIFECKEEFIFNCKKCTKIVEDKYLISLDRIRYWCTYDYDFEQRCKNEDLKCKEE